LNYANLTFHQISKCGGRIFWWNAELGKSLVFYVRYGSLMVDSWKTKIN
jgi:hypothetical protein